MRLFTSFLLAVLVACIAVIIVHAQAPPSTSVNVDINVLRTGFANIASAGTSVDAGGAACTAGTLFANATNVGSGQQFQFNGFTIKSFSVADVVNCPPNGGQAFLTDNGSGSAVLGPTGSTWTLTPSGSGFTVKSNLNNFLALVGGNMVMSPSVQTVWTFTQLPIPTAVTNSPTICNLTDATPVGTTCSTSTVAMSNGTQFWSFLRPNANADLFDVPFANSPGPYTVKTKRVPTLADNGKNTTLTALSGGGSATSASLTMNVTSGGGLTPPPQAQNVGFTTVALNADFRTSAFANTATWVNTCGASAPRWFLYYNFPTGGLDAPCDRVQMVADGALPQVMKLRHPTSDNGAGSSNALDYPVFNTGDNNTPQFPIEYYFEAMVRISSGITNSNTILDMYYGPRPEQGQGPNWVETDHTEVSNNDVGTAQFILWPSQCSGQCFSSRVDTSTDWTQYHILGALVTANESTNGSNIVMAICTYLDNNLIGCGHNLGWAPTAQQYAQRGHLLHTIGSAGDTVESDVLIQWIHVFECANWATTSCPTTPFCPGC